MEERWRTGDLYDMASMTSGKYLEDAGNEGTVDTRYAAEILADLCLLSVDVVDVVADY